MPSYDCHKHHLHWLGAHYLDKASWEISASSFKDFLSEVEKSAKTHELCIIILINPSSYNFLEKIIFDFQIAIDRAHPVQIASRSDYCISTHIMWKSPKKPKND